MVWHSFITNKSERKKRKKNLDENLEQFKEENIEGD